ncbi:AraC-like DNA-binding protein [Paucibacter oligotrophus]|uniref:AraC-like DNA-binding protein n=1 Tax=Roseateles oligotrophus TaxID=1769250 RepID=A0A840L6R9_9BURK|nr:AraC family transcriptional regulator [Roseateles oligotrophus]MBB4841859.1 AraC-like DNA-binding protein [Roseateles oligotrophus]
MASTQPRPSAAQQLSQGWERAAARRLLFESSDVERAQALVGRVFKPHRLEPRRNGPAGSGCRPVAMQMDHLPLGLLSMSRLRYGATVDILPGPLERFYLIQIPLQGRAEIASGGCDFLSDEACASLLSPQPDLRMRWHAGNEQLLLRIEACAVQRFAQSWCGQPTLSAPVFAPQLRLDALPALQDALLSLFDFAAATQEAERYPLSALQLQHRLIAALLAGQAHDHSPLLRGSGAPLAPRSVRLVEEFLLAHCHEALSPAQLAAVAGVSVRSLFLGFQRYRGVSPMRMLRELRLRHAHDDLLRAEPDSHITEVALRWGFYHLGRFAQEYREMFDESPRDTLASSRQG